MFISTQQQTNQLTSNQGEKPWQEILSYRNLRPDLRTPEQNRAIVESFVQDLVREGERFKAKPLSPEEYEQLVESVSEFMLSETFAYTASDGTGHVWNITKALGIIAASPRETLPFPVQQQGVDPLLLTQMYPLLDAQRAMESDLSVPLIAIVFKGALFLIDGWHRWFKALVRGERELKCYLLTEEESEAILTRFEPEE